ncbi:hypothetical protein DBR32_05230 [Taibaiella sp. KBW10]|uniref:GEVED domain-containing protein n=1 Tax=Taibaiella sp. KBW10 TaxID=2153357 RepID=UPI000F5A335B|nr:GEVED domain-containing protein [Taibaiella sp. KBW10]RQO31367.1 hypothetical protein DBR32_05230 [Taibaiella sp. KBW10]
MKKIFSLIITLSLFLYGTHAQEHRCAATEANEYQKNIDPQFAKSLELQKQQWINHNMQGKNNPAALVINGPNGPEYQVPIVFHIIHTGQAIGTPQNPSDATIQGLVDYLNAVYAATLPANPAVGSGGVNIPIRFVLAQRTPTCQATTGVNRVDGSSLAGYTTYGVRMQGATQGAPETSVKALSNWRNDMYMNIWIVTGIQGAAANGGSVAGYAYFPGVGSDIDGVVLRYDQTQWAIAHELGHSFGLYHTFEGSSGPTVCPGNANCVADGDMVCDTDPHALVSGCPTGTNTCTNNPYTPVVYNIMNYSSCPNRFSAGQKDRLIFQLINFRGSLLTSLGGLAPGSSPATNIAAPALACVPNAITNMNTADVGPRNVSFANLSYYSTGYTNDFHQFYIDNTTNGCMKNQQVANVTAGNTYTLSIGTGAANPEKTYAWIDWNNDGTFQAGENVMAIFATTGGALATANIVVPSTAVSCTPLRMRIASDFNSGSAPLTACANPVYGQVEDFTVIVGYNAPVATISSTTSTNCSGSAQSFTATASNGGTAPSYQWKVNGTNSGTNNSSFSYTPSNGDVVTCVVTSSLTCLTNTSDTSNAITVTVTNSVTPLITVAATNNNICSGTTMNFTATATNGGTAPNYQWKVNGTNTGTNSSTFSYVPANGDLVTCTLTGNATCATTTTANSNSITAVVTGSVTPTISIAAANNNICAGTTMNFTATATNGGTAPSYQWKVNGANSGTNSNTFSYVPANGDLVTCTLTGNATCATTTTANSNSITAVVTGSVTPTINIAAANNNICTGTTMNFTATATNGGTAPSYQWKVNGANSGTNSSTFSYVPANGDLVTCTLTGNATCATTTTANSNSITAVVTGSVTPSISIAAANNNICAGTTMNFTATATNGGTAPGYQWKVNGANSGTNSNAFSYVPANGDVVTCVLTSNANCLSSPTATSSSITAIVSSSVTPQITLAVTNNNICAGKTMNFTATATNGGTSPAYQWKVNGANSGTNSNAFAYVPANGDVISCTLTSNATCAATTTANSNNITAIVNPTLTAAVSLTANPSSNATIGNPIIYTANVTNATAYQLLWYANGILVQTTNSPVNTYTRPAAANPDTIRATLKVTGCYTDTAYTSSSIVVSNKGTGIDQLATELGLQVYPNPASHIVYIDVSKGKLSDLQLINNIGQVMEQYTVRNNKMSIVLRQYAVGIYHLKLTIRYNGIDYVIIRKVVKE